MGSTSTSTHHSVEMPEPCTIDMKLEVVTLPVSDVDRAKRFYQCLGWRLDADIVAATPFERFSSHRCTRPARSHSGKASLPTSPARFSACCSPFRTSTRHARISSPAASR